MKHNMKTRVTELLGIEYPIIQGGVAWVAEHNLAAAVSQAGGLGIIGAGGAPAAFVKEQIEKVKAVTDKPFGVNIMLLNPNAEEVAKIVVEEGGKLICPDALREKLTIDGWIEETISGLVMITMPTAAITTPNPIVTILRPGMRSSPMIVTAPNAMSSAPMMLQANRRNSPGQISRAVPSTKNKMIADTTCLRIR